MRIEHVIVDKPYVITAIENVTVDKSYVIMTIGNLTADKSYVTTTVENRIVDKSDAIMTIGCKTNGFTTFPKPILLKPLVLQQFSKWCC